MDAVLLLVVLVLAELVVQHLPLPALLLVLVAALAALLVLVVLVVEAAVPLRLLLSPSFSAATARTTR